jgi:hypothetical protein
VGDNVLEVTVKHVLSGKIKKILINRISGRVDVE